MWQGEDLLAAFREQRGPSPQAVERIAERLATLGPAREPAKVIALAPSRRTTRTARIAFVVGALAAAAVLGWWIRGVTLAPAPAVHGSLAEDRVEAEPSLGRAQPVERVVEPRGPERESPTIAPAPPIEPSTTEDPIAPEHPVPRARPLRRASTAAGAREVEDAPTPASASDTLAAEIALVQRARAQLSRGQAREALATLAEHAQQFPRGKLGEESAAVRTMAQCRLGPGDAERLRAAFVERHPRSLFRKQVEAACGATGKGEGE